MRAEPPTLDTTRRFVRVSGERPGGFIEFEFAIGEPDVFTELILGRQAFAQFCADNQAEVLPPRDPEAESGDWDWRLSDATHTRFRAP